MRAGRETDHPEAKLISRREALRLREEWKEKGLRLVVVNGAFDMLHVGHLRYLSEARGSGDILLLALNSDASVRSSKGPLRPIIPESERAEILSHLWMVDYILLFDEKSVGPLLEELRPEIHAKGRDYKVDTVPERSIVEAYGGETLICGDPKDHATTDLIGRILDRFGRGGCD